MNCFPLLTPTSFLWNPRSWKVNTNTCIIKLCLGKQVSKGSLLKELKQTSVALGLSWKAASFLAQKTRSQAHCLSKADLFQHHNILLHYTIKITLMAGRTLLSVHILCTKTVVVASSTCWGKGHWNRILHSQRDGRKLFYKNEGS